MTFNLFCSMSLPKPGRKFVVDVVIHGRLANVTMKTLALWFARSTKTSSFSNSRESNCKIKVFRVLASSCVSIGCLQLRLQSSRTQVVGKMVSSQSSTSAVWPFSANWTWLLRRSILVGSPSAGVDFGLVSSSPTGSRPRVKMFPASLTGFILTPPPLGKVIFLPCMSSRTALMLVARVIRADCLGMNTSNGFKSSASPIVASD
mmetsp:Transcript_11942/g.27902  ORF Transcript_11942/g.27902 Transcript_11942/m.27902 type:complete len:204 (-) Transcript_11942:624-1235(-)